MSTISLVASCNVSVNFENATFRCEEAPFECPDGRTCVEGLCREALDADGGTDGPLVPLGYTERALAFATPFAGSTTDVTVFVLLNSERVDYSAAGAAAGSLEFRDAGNRILPFEIATWDPNGESQLWVRLFDTTSDDPIVMRYGETIVGGPGSSAQVWPDHNAVLHFEDDASDSSPAELSSSFQGSAAIGSGYVGNAVSLDGIDGYVELGRDIVGFNGKSQTTLSTWVNYRPVGGSRGIIEFSNGPGTVSRSVLSLTPEFEPRMGLLTDDEEPTSENAVGDELPGNTWHWLVGTADLMARTADIYVDGVRQDSIALVTSTKEFPATNSAIAVVGRNDTTSSGFLEANIDEVRSLTRAITATDVSVIYHSMTQELFAFGPAITR